MSKIPAKRVPPSPSKIVFRPPRASSASRPSAPFKVGDRVIANGKTGTIAFIGTTKFAAGEWFGINLDEAVGKNDGSHEGVRYFETDPDHGLFCRSDKVQRLAINGAPQRKSLNTFSRQSSTEGRLNNKSRSSSIVKEDLTSKNLQLGDRVLIQGAKSGTLKYIGKIHIEEGIWCGIKLDGPLGKHDGKIDSKRYFHCPHLHGLFAPLRHVEKLLNESTIDHRLSIISTDSSHHNLDSNHEDLNLSEFSTSSDSLNQFPTRSPKKIPPPNLSTEPVLSNQVELIRDKDLLINKLEQEIVKAREDDFQTTEKINEMEEQIRQLHLKYENAEIENFNLIREQFELKERLDDLQDQLTLSNDHHLLSPAEFQLYEKIKEKIQQLESINESLIQENQHLQDELKQSLESSNPINYDEQIRDYQTNIDQATRETEQIRIELKQIQDQNNEKERLINELKADYEKSEISLNNSDSERQIKEYQENLDRANRETERLQAELTKFEQENISISSLKDEYERQLAALKEELEEAQDVVSTEPPAVDYELKFKLYEMKFEQDDQDREKLENEFKSLREEKISQEEEHQETIARLKQDYQELQREIDELNQREIKAHKTLHQHEAQLDGQIDEARQKLEEANLQIQQLQIELEEANLHQTITDDLEALKLQLEERDQKEKEYQSQLDQSLLELQHLQTKLINLEEEKSNIENQLNQIIHEHNSELESLKEEKVQLNNTIDSLTQELQALKTEFQDRDQDFQTKLDQSLLEIEHLRSRLTALDQEKNTMENGFNENINTLKQDYEKVHHEQKQKEKILQARYDQEFDEYQKTLELSIGRISELTQLQEEQITNEKLLNEKIESLQTDLQEQRELIERQKIEWEAENQAREERLKEYDSTLIQATESVETLTQINMQLKKELQDLQNQYDPKEIELLTQQITDLQQMNLNRLEKQSTKEQEYLAEKKVWQDKIADYEMKIALMKSEHMVDMENTKLDHDQEILRLKSLLPKSPPIKGKN